MENIRKYGKAPFTAAVIHGGPGAAGEMAEAAIVLSVFCGVMEPLQTAMSIKGQLQELHSILTKYGNLPVTLIGYSWGAWLSYIFTAQNPEFVRKLIIVSSGPFEEKYALKIMETRLSRLNEDERFKAQVLMKELNSGNKETSKQTLVQFGELMSKADIFSPIPDSKPEEPVEINIDIYQEVWKEAEELRRNGGLLKLGKKIYCPVIAIHGDYDSHPAEGVEKPLSQNLKDFRFILLKNCGHKPWIERNARDRFYEILKMELLYI